MIKLWDNLQILSLNNNQLSTLPVEIGYLFNLQILSLNNNQLSTLPVEIGYLKKLSKLQLDKNPLRTPPLEIVKQGTPAILGYLRVLQNEVSVSSHISKYTVISDQEVVKQFQQYLKVYGYGEYGGESNWNPDERCLSHDPPYPGRCEYDKQGRLIKLHLCSAELKRVPSEIGQFLVLQELHLESIGGLEMLPAEIGNLSSLQELHLINSSLKTLPAEIGDLSSLRVLDLLNSSLKTLPAEIGNLTSLQWLNLRSNQLSTLPPEMGNLFALHTLKLDGNPLQTPPQEIIAQGTPAILAYLRSLQQKPAPPSAIPFLKKNAPNLDNTPSIASATQLDPLVERFEAKVILVGEGGMGKTSLLRALSRQPFTQDLSATHGIEIGTLRVPHPTRTQQEIALYTWDFGGQEIYQATHQFFLTHRSVYLLVWNARLGVEACRLPFWLDTITGHAPDAKILLVATHSDLWQTPTINLASFQQRYPQIVGLWSISNRTGNGLGDLKTQIAQIAAQIPFVGQKWPRTWVNAEQQLLAHPEHHIDVTAFIDICIQQKLEDETERETLGRYLHDLGKILYFSDDPVLKSLVVLKPNWISKAISQVLVDPNVQQMGGVLEHQELGRIWATDDQGQAYSRALYPIFVRMMERFELCYQIEPERPGQPISQSLIPQLLPDQPPAKLSPVPTVPEAEQALVEMRYLLSFVPTGLMSWFLVRTHRYSQRQHWREGARLAYVGQQAQIELDAQQRAISIRVWGPFPYTFLLILKQTLDDLLQSFQGLRVQRRVPCCCTIQQQVPHYHDYEVLERKLAKGHTETVCDEGMTLSLSSLLYGMHASTIPQMVETVQQTQHTIAYTNLPVADLLRSQAKLEQSQEFILRTLLHLTNFEQQKEQTPCPSLFLLERETGHRFDPRDWMSRAYRLRLLCQYPAGPHLLQGEPGDSLREGKDWWKTMSPWLRRLVVVLKTGVPLGKAVGEVFDQVDTERLATQIDLFNEILY